jgi:hypothetical protein
MSSLIDGYSFFPLSMCEILGLNDQMTRVPPNQWTISISQSGLQEFQFSSSRFLPEHFTWIPQSNDMCPSQINGLCSLQDFDTSTISNLSPSRFPRDDNLMTHVLFNPMAILFFGTLAFGTSGLWVSTGGKNPEEKLLK